MADSTGQVSSFARFQADRVSFEDQGDPNGPRVFIGAPDFRVFIWGYEITNDVFSVSVKHGLNDNLSTVQINLVNDNQKWVVPPGAGLSGFGASPDEWTGLNPLNLVGDPEGTNTVQNKVNTLSFAQAKLANFRKAKSKFLGKAVFDIYMAGMPHANIFPMVPGMPLIQAPDPIRVFLKNPWNLARRQKLPVESIPIVGDNSVQEDSVQKQLDGPPSLEEEWYFAFTGFCAAVTEDFDSRTNRSILRIYGEETRRFLRYMLITTNPDTIDLSTASGDTVGTPEQMGELTNTPAFSRLVNANQAFEAGMTLPDAYQFIFFGDTTQTAAGEGGGAEAVRFSGVPGFDRSRLRKETISIGDNIESDMSRRLDDMYPQLDESQVTEEGAKFDFDDLRLWIVLPDPAGFQKTQYPFDWAFRAEYFSEFRSRFDILDEFTKKLDCIWYGTPRGDVVLEFPQYDQIPQKHTEPWNSILTIQNEWMGFNLTDDDRNIRTLTLMPKSALPGYDTSRYFPLLSTGRAQDNVLIARYGLRAHFESRPFQHNEQTAVGSAYMLAAMHQSLANADSNRLEGLDALPNFRCHVGRPVFFKFRNMIGFLTRLQHQVIWGEDARTIYGLQYLRMFDPSRREWVRLSQDFGWNWTGPKSSGLNTTGFPGPTQVGPSTASPATNTPDSLNALRSQQSVMSQSPDAYTPRQIAKMDQLLMAAEDAQRRGDNPALQQINERAARLLSDKKG